MTTQETTPEALDAFVAGAKAKGIPDESLVALLRQNGWSERRVYRSLALHYAAIVGVVPPNLYGGSENARDAFLYLVNFSSLGLWAISLGQLFYTLIARWFPDAAVARYDRGESLVMEIAWQIAAIGVAFPVFAFVHRIIETQLRRKPDAAESGVRLWLTYVALVLAALVCMGDAMWFLEAFIRGDLTTRFVLDSLVLAVLGGGIFGYYLSGLQRARSAQ